MILLAVRCDMVLNALDDIKTSCVHYGTPCNGSISGMVLN